MEMMQAPTPLSEEKKFGNIININDLKIKETFKLEENDLTIGLLEANLIFICSNKEKIYQVLKNYDEITKEIPNFKLSQNINSIYNLLVQIFSAKRYEIKPENENQLKIIIKLKDILGNDEMHEILLFQKELDTKTKIKLMEERIKILEKKVEEMDELKKNINILFNENKLLKEEINKLKSNKDEQIIIPEYESKIINKKEKIIFILKEIEKAIGSFNNIKLIYRATRDGDSIENFHSKCDNIRNTLMIVETTTGYIFGGFTSVGWNNNKGKDIYDNKAFCFSLNLKKIYNIINPNYALHIQSNGSRPSFGSNSYVFILQNQFLKSEKSYTEKISDFEGESQACEINGGNGYFKVKELEVFQIL